MEMKRALAHALLYNYVMQHFWINCIKTMFNNPIKKNHLHFLHFFRAFWKPYLVPSQLEALAIPRLKGIMIRLEEEEMGLCAALSLATTVERLSRTGFVQAGCVGSAHLHGTLNFSRSV